MKKLMTMIAAVATAFGLYAADSHYYSTSFEAGVDTGCTGETFDPETAGWTAGTLTEAIGLGEYTDGEGYDYAGNIGERRTFASPLNNNYLKLETGSKTLGVALNAADIFIDQTVQFTGYEEFPAADAIDGQIAIWASAIDTDTDGGVEGETNLYARVGTGNGYQDVKINIDFDPAEWYRVTIKSLGNVLPEGATSQAGFLIYINGVPATTDAKYSTLADVFNDNAKRYYAKGQLFTGLKTDSAAIANVAFQGIGYIDDFVTSVEAPDFAAEVPFNVVVFDGADIAKVVKIEDGEEVDLDGNYAVMPGTTVRVYYTPAENWKLTKNTYSEVISEADQDVDGSAEIEPIEGYAKITRPGVADPIIVGADELNEAIALVQDGDKVTFLKACSILEGGYRFTQNTTIDVSEGGNWAVNIANVDEESCGSLENNIDVVDQKTITVTYGDAIDYEGGIVGMLVLNGDIEAGSSIDADEKGVVEVMSAITVAGTLKAAELWIDESIALEGAGKVLAKDNTFGEQITVPAGKQLKVSELPDADGYYTYQIKQETGFAIIIAGTPVYYNTLQEAIDAYEGKGEVTLMDNAEIPAFISITKNVTLNLNGFTLAREDDDAMLKSLFEISNEATLTVNANGGAAKGRLASVGKQITVGNGSNGKLIVNGGTYTAGATQTAIHVNGDCSACEVTINDATIVSTGDNGVQFNGKGTFAINRSSITGATAIYMKAGTLAIDEDSVITATAATWTAPVENHNGSNPTGDAIVMDSITGYKGEISLTVADGATVTSVAGATIRETITAGADSTTVKIDAPSIAGIALTPQFIAMVAAGTAQLPGYVAVIGTVPYKTLQAAITAAGAEATVKLIANAVENVTVAADKDITLDLNGKTLASVTTTSTYVINNLGTLVIDGEGTVSTTTCGNSLIRNIGTMTIESGVFTSNKIVVKNDEDGFGTCGVLAINGGGFTPGNGDDLTWNALQNWGVAVIKDGTFNGSVYSWACLDWNAGNTTINGGTFNGDVATVARYKSTRAANPAPDRDAVVTIQGGTFNADIARLIGYDVNDQGETKRWDITDPALPERYADCENLGIITIVGEVEEGVLNAAQFKNDESVYCETGYETVKLDDAQYYTVAVKAPAEPVAEVNGVEYTDLHEAVDAVKDGETLTLLCNVDLEGVDWVPVMGFKGTFDGQNFIISNLTINAASANEVGLIGSSSDTFVKNVKFANANVTGNQKVGVIVGVGKFSASNVAVVDSTVTGIYHVGGLFGNQQAAVSFDQITVTGCTITIPEGGSKKVGAIGGYFCGEKALALFSNCIVRNNTISGPENVGAILGQANNYSTFDNVVVNQPGMHFVGGFAGSDAYLTLIEGADTVITTADFCESGKYFWKPTLRGGTYSFEPTADIAIIEDEYKVIDNDDDTWTVVAKAQVALTISAENATVTGIEAGTVLEGSNLTFKVAANTGYKLVDVKANGEELEADAQGNYTYAVTGEETEQALEIVVTVEQDAKPVNPEEPKQYNTPEEAADAAKAINDNKETMIITPLGAVAADYTALFTAVVTADNKVVVELNENGTNTLAQSAEKVVEKATGLGDSTATTVTITPAATDIVPGFYYGLGASTEVAGEKGVTSWQQATTEGLKEPLTANKPENSTKGFFQVRVSVRQQN